MSKEKTSSVLHINRLATLSRLNISESECESVSRELKLTADYIYPRLQGTGNALPFSALRPCHSTEELREDTPCLPTLSATSLAPDSREGFVCVPQVIIEEEV